MEHKKAIKVGFTIIVIEDNLGDFILIEDYLLDKFNDINIKHFLNYESVANYFQLGDAHCDLILLDLNLPDKSGLELVYGILGFSVKVPIIILTGYADLPLAKKSLALGVYDFLVKDEINPILLHKSIEFAKSRSSYVLHIESQNEKLRNIAWTQSHIVRAPLARILAIMNLIEENKANVEDLFFWVDQLRSSTNEMDEVVKKIVAESQTQL